MNPCIPGEFLIPAWTPTELITRRFLAKKFTSYLLEPDSLTEPVGLDTSWDALSQELYLGWKS